MPHRALNAVALNELHDRRARAITRRPTLARATGQSCVHLAGGFICDVHHDEVMTVVDQPASEGGAGTSADPEQLLRASLGAALAMGYRLWGARLGVPIDAADLEVTCEYDLRGRMGLDQATPVGWQRLHVHVAIVSDAPLAEVRQVVEAADRLNPILANLSPAVQRIHRLTVIKPRRTAVSPPAGSAAGAAVEHSVPSQVTPSQVSTEGRARTAAPHPIEETIPENTTPEQKGPRP